MYMYVENAERYAIVACACLGLSSVSEIDCCMIYERVAFFPNECITPFKPVSYS